MAKLKKNRDRFAELKALMARLREPGGCPWDRAQTLKSVRAYLIEESQEVFEAIEKRDYENLKEELGDVLLNIVFQARLAEEEGHFTFEEVVDGIIEKMVRRHPHVFGKEKLGTPEEVLARWHQIKANEKQHKNSPLS